MWKITEAEIYCHKFSFEIPLEDLFPYNHLHPKIDLLYTKALDCFVTNNVTSDILLVERDESAEEKLQLKEMMLNSKCLKGTPQSFLWLIDYLLGMLPIQLMPPYLTDQTFEWLRLSKICKKLFQMYRKEGFMDYDWEYELADEISKLPHQHYLLLSMHIVFMRRISFFPKKKRLRKRNIIYYTKYFTPSIFLRPFNPGLTQDIAKEYRFILLYLVLRWPFINKLCTHACLSTILEVSENEMFNDSDVFPESYNECHEVSNISNENETTKKFPFKKLRCCCSIGTNYTQNSKENNRDAVNIIYQNPLKNTLRSISITTVNKYDTDKEEEAENNKEIKHTLLDTTLESENTPYEESFIYDDYDTFQNETFNQISKEVSLLDTNDKSFNEKEDKRTTKLEKAKIYEETNFDQYKNKNVCSKCRENYKETENTELGRDNNKNVCEIKEKLKDNKDIEKNKRSNRESKDPTTTPTNKANKEEQGLSAKFNCGKNTEQLIDNTKPITINPNTLKRVAKLGWTYTPSKISSNAKGDSINASNLIIDNEIVNEQLIDNSQSQTSVKKYQSIRSLKAKLSFFKIGKKKSKNKNQETNLKYEKINS